MRAYIVTNKSQEEDTVGRILRVDVTCFGVYTSLDQAVAIAAKYNGSYQEIVVDQESRSMLEHWENPGYVS